MLVNLVIGLEKVLFLTLVDSVESRIGLGSVLGVVASRTLRRLAVSVIVVVRHTSRVMVKCGTSAIGTEKAP